MARPMLALHDQSIAQVPNGDGDHDQARQDQEDMSEVA
jgi:hypothetical protein